MTRRPRKPKLAAGVAYLLNQGIAREEGDPAQQSLAPKPAIR
jgi:hypothetical protein